MVVAPNNQAPMVSLSREKVSLLFLKQSILQVSRVLFGNLLERLLLGRPEVVGRKVIAMTVAIDLGRCNSESPADYCLQDIIVFRFSQKFLDQNRYKFPRQAAATISIACCSFQLTLRLFLWSRALRSCFVSLPMSTEPYQRRWSMML